MPAGGACLTPEAVAPDIYQKIGLVLNLWTGSISSMRLPNGSYTNTRLKPSTGSSSTTR